MVPWHFVVRNQLSRRRKSSKTSTRKHRLHGSSSLGFVQKESGTIPSPASEEVEDKLSSPPDTAVVDAEDSDTDVSDADKESYPYPSFMPLGRSRPITEKEKARYTRKVQKSRGYDAPLLPGVVFQGMKFPTCCDRTVEKLTEFAIKAYNSQQGTDLQLVRVLKVTSGVDAPRTYYITLEAKDTKGKVRTYQTMVRLVRNVKIRKTRAHVVEFFKEVDVYHERVSSNCCSSSQFDLPFVLD